MTDRKMPSPSKTHNVELRVSIVVCGSYTCQQGRNTSQDPHICIDEVAEYRYQLRGKDVVVLCLCRIAVEASWCKCISVFLYGDKLKQQQEPLGDNLRVNEQIHYNI